MEARALDRLKHLTNTEVVRRFLIKYFISKGFTESFDRLVYPALLQDLPLAVPVLAPKIEITPFMLELDQALGKAVLGWNLFVLGNRRMYLGDTYHNDLNNLARQIHDGLIKPPDNQQANARRQTTPRRIITFITRVLSDHRAGYVDLTPHTQPARKLEDLYGRGMMSSIGQYGRRF